VYAAGQVRRMTGVLVAAGRRIISIDDVRRMVAEPDNASLQRHEVFSKRVPSHGLYLASVEYDDKGRSLSLSIYYNLMIVK